MTLKQNSTTPRKWPIIDAPVPGAPFITSEEAPADAPNPAEFSLLKTFSRKVFLLQQRCLAFAIFLWRGFNWLLLGIPPHFWNEKIHGKTDLNWKCSKEQQAGASRMSKITFPCVNPIQLSPSRGERIIRYSNIIRIVEAEYKYSYSYSGDFFKPNNIRICIRSKFSNRIIFVFVFGRFFQTE